MTQTDTQEDAAVGLCWECGYPLKGLPTPRCPECGRPFDPADPATMNMGEHVGAFAARLLRPPGWPLYTATACAALVSVWAAAAPMPSGQIGPMLASVWERASRAGWVGVLSDYGRVEVRYACAVLAWLVVAAAWTARRVARGVTVRRIAPGQRAAPFAYWRRWLIPHFVLLATILFCRTSAPVFVGFWVSSPWLNGERLALTARSPRMQVVATQKSRWWIGVYPIDRGMWFRRGGTPDAGGTYVITVSEFGGFVHSPSGRPVWNTGDELHDLGGGWYSFHEADVYR
jgi:hypothetical protein